MNTKCFSSYSRIGNTALIRSLASSGKPLVNLLPLEANERINAVLPIREYDDKHFVFMATSAGTVKKTALENFSRPRTAGIIAVDLREDDVLVDVALTDGSKDIMLLSTAGKAVRFSESAVRPTGRTAAGVRGIKLGENHKVMSLIVVDDAASILTATENGFGKRTVTTDYPCKGRGTQGVISIQTSERNGAVIGAVQVKTGDEIMLISNGGTLVRTSVDEVRDMGRNTQGVMLIRLSADEKLCEIERVEKLEGGLVAGLEDGQEGDLGDGQEDGQEGDLGDGQEADMEGDDADGAKGE